MQVSGHSSLGTASPNGLPQAYPAVRCDLCLRFARPTPVTGHVSVPGSGLLRPDAAAPDEGVQGHGPKAQFCLQECQAPPLVHHFHGGHHPLVQRHRPLRLPDGGAVQPRQALEL